MLWGAFNNAASGMMAMSVDMGSISQNIANVNTTGYKRTETRFSTVMSESHVSPNSYVAGLKIFGVQTSQRNLIDAQGLITPSSTWSDLAINGRGFFMVAPGQGGGAPSTVNTASQNSVLYTRDGSWHRTYGPDTDPNLARNYFVTGSGNYLLGWMADDTGTIPSNATLQPVYTLGPRPIPGNGTPGVDEASTLTPSSQMMPGRATTMAQILANIPRDAPLGGTSTTVPVVDGNGDTQELVLTWTRTSPYTWTVTPAAAPDNPYVTGFSTASWEVTMDDAGVVTSPVGTQSLDITWDAAHGNGTVTSSLSLASPPPRAELQKVSLQVFDSAYNEHTLTLSFERIANNQWYMYPDPGTGMTPGTRPEPVLLEYEYDSGTSTEGKPDGQLKRINGGAVTPYSLSLSYDTTVNGVTTTNPITMSLDLSKLTQYDSSTVYRNNVVTDGYGQGTLMATSFNDLGELNGYYSNGRSRVLFKVPVATFVAENQLNPISGNLFQRTAAAGDLTVSGIDKVPGEGRFSPSSLETSTVEIEDEFTRMIMTQKAYTMNSQVFKTADEMTALARDLKR
jgi:fagellar hook-basal body proteins/fagellar hook-basal body proteins